jgi:hypothetical protein
VEALLLTCAIDAKEGRDLATVDIPGAFTQADMDDEIIHVRLHGRMAEHMTEIDPVYKNNSGKERNHPVLRLLKALCGTLRAARLFWKHYRKSLLDGVSKQIHMTGVWPTRRLTGSNVPFDGT